MNGAGPSTGQTDEDFLESKDFRRNLRHQFRLMKRSLHDNRQELVDPKNEVDGLSAYLDQTDILFDKVRLTREGVLDSSTMSEIAALGKLRSQNMCPGLTPYSSNKFMARLREIYGEGGRMAPKSWEEMGRAVKAMSRRAPALQFVHLEDGEGEETPVKTVRRQRQKDVTGASVAPKEVGEENTGRNEVTSQEVERIFGRIQMYFKKFKTPVDYFEFVVHPDSFGQTVENMFHVSFLLRDDYVELKLDDNNLPVLMPVPTEHRYELQQASKQQMIVSLTPVEWRDIVKSYELEGKTPLIGSRGGN